VYPRTFALLIQELFGLDVEGFQEPGQTGRRGLGAATVHIVAPPCGPGAVIPVNEGMEEVVGGHLHLPVKRLPDVVEHQDPSRVVGVRIRVERHRCPPRLDPPVGQVRDCDEWLPDVPLPVRELLGKIRFGFGQNLA
jgi:hypothetical protein